MPTTAPIPAVKAIASVPQKVTRRVPFAPSARALIALSSARNTRDVIETTGTTTDWGETRTIESGITAPAANFGGQRGAYHCAGPQQLAASLPPVAWIGGHGTSA